MKKSIAFILAIIAWCIQSNGQVCCSKPAKSVGMAVFASNKDFHAAHLSPEPIHYVAEKGEMLIYKTDDGKSASAFVIKASKKTDKVLFVVHEWWGLNDHIKREAEQLQKELGDVDVYALDLYDGKFATDPQEAGKLMGGMAPERAVSIIKGALSVVGTKAKVATIGWCMGGSWSFQTALLAGKQTQACVMYYGFPEKDVNKMKTLNSDVLFIHATQDAFIDNATVDKFASDLKSVGKNITLKQYAADHAFANPSNPKFQKEFTEEAHKISLDYIKKGLGL